MKEYKSILLFSIPYFTICGGIYHLAFWSTFDINGLAYLGLQDIIKSFIYPFISIFIFSFFGLLFSEVFMNPDKILPPGGGANTKFGQKLNSEIGITISLFIWFNIVLLLYFWDNIYKWFLLVVIIGLLPFIIIIRHQLLDNFIQNYRVRKFFSMLLVFIPLFSFATGKYNSQIIHRNIEYKYTISHKLTPNSNTTQVDTLKFIGNAGNQVFLTDFSNSTIYMLRADNIDTLILKQHKR